MPIQFAFATSNAGDPQDVNYTTLIGADAATLGWRVTGVNEAGVNRVTVGTGGVSAWADRSNKGANLTQSDDTRRPALITGALNVAGRVARDTVRFDKANRDNFYPPELLPTSGGAVTSFSLVLVTQIVEYAGSTTSILGSDTTQATRMRLLHGAGGILTWQVGGSTSGVQASAQLPFSARPGGAPHPILMEWDSVLHRASISVDGITWYDATNLDASLTIDNFAVGGSKGTSPSTPVNSAESFDLYEIMTRSGVLRGTPMLTTIRDYLRARYRFAV